MYEDSPSTSRGNPSMYISTTQRGSKKIIRHGYEYVIKRTNIDGAILWRCAKMKSCFATIKTNRDFNVIKHETTHSHEPMDTAEVEIKIQMDKCGKTVQENLSDPISKIFEENMAPLEDRGINIIKKLPALKNVQKTLYKKRNKSIGASKVTFKKAKDVEVPQKFQKILFADYAHKNRILIFADDELKEYMGKCKHFYMDGTFKTCPKPFYQLYTIHAELESNEEYQNIIPVLYALLPDKKLTTYKLLFQLIRSQIPQWNPSDITVDFEVAAIQAIRSHFPNVKITGCYFHFRRCLWRKAKTLGVCKTQLGKDHVKLCAALSHLPPELIDDGWLYIMEEAPESKCVTQFNDYFVKTWLENSPLVNTWCTYQQMQKTNNVVESWNGHIQKYIKNRPNIAQLLVGLSKDINLFSSLLKKPTDLRISKRLPQTIEKKKKIDISINKTLNGQITVGHCLEKLRF